jgi:Fuc2NAc and GlcNAc transferase
LVNHVETALICLLAFAAASLVTAVVRRSALREGVLDMPNQRSSHSAPTPRGGGSSIVVVLSLIIAYLGWRGQLDGPQLLLLLGGGGAVAAVGYFDDRRQLSPLVRLMVHLGAAILAVVVAGGLPPVQLGSTLYDLGLAGDIVAVVGLVWVLNLFNFMDGIDGIAGVEAICVLAGASLLLSADSATTGIAWAGAACTAGFLTMNWPPAKIFMGDVGSGYLGYVLGVLALLFARQDPRAIPVFLVLGGVFVMDATITLTRRLVRRERVFEAHRMHAYQHLAQRWNSHRRVTLGVLALNVAWLFPCAAAVVHLPSRNGWMALVALGPLGLLAVWLGAGRPADNGRAPASS